MKDYRLLLLVGLLSLLVIVAGCGKGVNAGHATFIPTVNGNSCVAGAWYYQEGTKLQGPFNGCTEYTSAGKPWCAITTKSINNKKVYVSGGKAGIDWDYCAKEQSGPVSCPGGTKCDGTSVTGTDGQVVCGTDLQSWKCTSGGWKGQKDKCVCESTNLKIGTNCVDSDKGKDYKTQGVMTADPVINNAGKKFTDVCANSGMLQSQGGDIDPDTWISVSGKQYQWWEITAAKSLGKDESNDLIEGSCDQNNVPTLEIVNCQEALKSDLAYCKNGACVLKTGDGTGNCPAGTTPCGPKKDCIGTTSDPSNCGGCGNWCFDSKKYPGVKNTECVNSVCVVKECKAGFNVVNGICFSLPVVKLVSKDPVATSPAPQLDVKVVGDDFVVSANTKPVLEVQKSTTDLSKVVIQEQGSKIVVQGLVGVKHYLYISDTKGNGVFVCPSATSLEQVKTGCVGQKTYTKGACTAPDCTFDGAVYKVLVSGSGGDENPPVCAESIYKGYCQGSVSVNESIDCNGVVKINPNFGKFDCATIGRECATYDIPPLGLFSHCVLGNTQPSGTCTPGPTGKKVCAPDDYGHIYFADGVTNADCTVGPKKIITNPGTYYQGSYIDGKQCGYGDASPLCLPDKGCCAPHFSPSTCQGDITINQTVSDCASGSTTTKIDCSTFGTKYGGTYKYGCVDQLGCRECGKPICEKVSMQDPNNQWEEKVGALQVGYGSGCASSVTPLGTWKDTGKKVTGSACP